ncbi:hypothetical protein CYMTET_11640 [Cymbomonas tetramitiformis]|uniref:Uncharacterized protein n=1 Tax=Cymbomonas tetramitiformis TaxID=36881 RepID=A0AAE0LCY6_9CHLO|nr:hypothetical protein CYMTET_46963 [Cymbomonas tetramitiformis]KAK3280517.1 hypothetical protein CYMTET_11640 [Cymbomonas tetramitiformis]
MYTLTANARDGETMRPLHGDGAVEKYVAGRIAARSEQHPLVSRWLRLPKDPWKEWGWNGQEAQRMGGPAAGPRSGEYAAQTAATPQDHSQDLQVGGDTELKEEYLEQLLLEEHRQGQWEAQSPPEG